jgi:hypothetical protein
LLALLLAIWPILAFVFFIRQGFDPYEELSQAEMAKKGGSFAPILAAARSTCHYMLTGLTIYLIALWITMIFLRKV